MKLDLKNLSRRPRPAVNFRLIAERILNRDYELSLVLVNDARARDLNRHWRAQNKAANVLSFPLTPDAGEIFLNLDRAHRDARSGGDSLAAEVRYLFIHGLLHLKGLRHGSKMESRQNQLVKYFQTYEPNDRHRAGRRQRRRPSRRL